MTLVDVRTWGDTPASPVLAFDNHSVCRTHPERSRGHVAHSNPVEPPDPYVFAPLRQPRRPADMACHLQWRGCRLLPLPLGTL